MMADPDVPSRADRSMGEARHWTVGNIMGSNIASGETFVDFIGSGPLAGSGLHRYVFLIFHQPSERIQFNETHVPINNLRDRLKTKTQEFADKYQLGRPVAGNFYMAEFDSYVPTLHAQFTIV